MRQIVPKIYPTIAKYHHFCNVFNDIREHLPTLMRYAKECERVFESGVRSVVSSWAFLYGLAQNGKEVRSLTMNDISRCPVSPVVAEAGKLGVYTRAIWKNNLDIDLRELGRVDLTFIDTWHVYAQLIRELEKFCQVTDKYIILHDTTVDEWVGETIRNGWNAEEQAAETGLYQSWFVAGSRRFSQDTSRVGTTRTATALPC